MHSVPGYTFVLSLSFELRQAANNTIKTVYLIRVGKCRRKCQDKLQNPITRWAKNADMNFLVSLKSSNIGIFLPQ